ncbi:MAG: hypothetical protein HKM06_00525 [Spirochaetales bacterium]|nr:hypothetical protein [Spirochaetales bacterium]
MKILTWIFVSAATFALSACSSLPSGVGDVLGSVSSLTNNASSADAVATAAAPIGFPSGDVLADNGTSQTDGDNWWVVKVLTPPSADTKNQAKVLRVEDGKEYWANFVTPTHKTVQADLVLGAKVFFMPQNSMDNKVTETEYTQYPWQLGRVTSVDDLFKGEVQINGTEYYIKWTRMAN